MISHVISARIILVLIAFNLFVNLSAIHNNAQSTIESNQPLTRDADLGPINWQLLAPSSPQAGPSNSPQAGPSNSPQAGPPNPPQLYNPIIGHYVPFKIKELLMLTLDDDPYICFNDADHKYETFRDGRPIICTPDNLLTTDKKKAIEDSVAHAIEYLSSHLTVHKDVNNFVPGFDWIFAKGAQDLLHDLNLTEDMFENATHYAITHTRYNCADKITMATSIPFLFGPNNFPYISILTLNLYQVKDEKSNMIAKYENHLTILHELLHSIGFTNFVFSGKNMMKQVEIFGKEYDQGKITVRYLHTPNVLKVARKHFGCKSLERAYLIPGDHWNPLIYRDEIMYPYNLFTRISTELSFAALEDTKFFKVIIPGEPLRFGKGAGCVLPNDFIGKHSNLCNLNLDDSRCSSDGMSIQKCQSSGKDSNISINHWNDESFCHKPDVLNRSTDNTSSNDFAVCDLNSIRLFENKPTDYIQYNQDYVCSNVHCLSKKKYIAQIGRFYYPCEGNSIFKVHLFNGNYICSPNHACRKYKKIQNDKWPVIKSVNKKVARPGDIIVIKGINFSNSSHPLICIENIKCKVTKKKGNSISCRVGKASSIKKPRKFDILYLDELNNMGNALLKGITIRRKVQRKEKKKEEQKKERLTAGNHPQPHNPNNSGTKPINSSPGSGSPSRPPKPLPVQPPRPVQPPPPRR